MQPEPHFDLVVRQPLEQLFILGPPLRSFGICDLLHETNEASHRALAQLRDAQRISQFQIVSRGIIIYLVKRDAPGLQERVSNILISRTLENIDFAMNNARDLVHENHNIFL
jgi:hypothetical protein